MELSHFRTLARNWEKFGHACDARLGVTAPDQSGDYVLDIDLVQERICWFAERGSSTGRQAISVQGPDQPATATATAAAAAPAGLFAKLRRRFASRPPFFEMHVLPRAEVEQTVASAGGVVLHAIDDGAAGAGWLSYTYVCRKLS